MHVMGFVKRCYRPICRGRCRGPSCLSPGWLLVAGGCCQHLHCSHPPGRDLVSSLFKAWARMVIEKEGLVTSRDSSEFAISEA